MPIEIQGTLYYTVKEACEYLGISRVTLDAYVARGYLAKYHKGLSRKVYYMFRELEYLKRQMDTIS